MKHDKRACRFFISITPHSGWPKYQVRRWQNPCCTCYKARQIKLNLGSLKMRKTLLAVTFSAAVAFLATTVQAHIKHTGPATLSSASIVFHVKDDDKDHDSTESIVVTCGQYNAGTLQNAGSGTVWHDQSDIAPLFLNNIDRDIEPSDCGTIHVTIDHSTVGNDNFKFTFTVLLGFTDGTTYTYQQPSKVELTKDNGHGEWDLTHS